jgi:uncharacterized protein YndB with AHSA1/START domain
MIHFEVSKVIDASPETIYAVLSDYHVGHPAILPKYFSGLTIEQGGQGAGTVIHVEMNVMGLKQAYHMVVSEPQPGRKLVETDAAQGTTTSFTVDPLNGNQSRVTIATDSPASPGLRGQIEKIMNPMVARRIYREELQLLADYVKR